MNGAQDERRGDEQECLMLLFWLFVIGVVLLYAIRIVLGIFP